jgi:glucosamine-6-phosphate deaminase
MLTFGFMSQPIQTFKNANDLYYAVHTHLQAKLDLHINQNHLPSLALATGNTMIPLYRIITEHQDALKTTHWKCFNLDEYYPITDETLSLSFARYMETFFYSRLKQPVYLREHLNGQTSDPAQECLRYEKKIQQEGGIDIAILGLGQNGHIGFNEPGSEPLSRTHLVQLHADTLIANFKTSATPIQQAMTLGIDSILESRHIIVIALGKSKAAAVKAAIQETPTRTCPASFLQDHYSVQWFLDSDAASLL